MNLRFKRKKLTKYRGSKTHGGGSMKKRRGAGNRGGRGMAGTGKRGDAKKPSVWANKNYFGKRGFKPQNKKIIKSCSLLYIEKSLPTFIRNELVKEESGMFVIDLATLGFDKLLSQGNVTKKFKITAWQASTKTIEKVKAAGGEVIVLSKPSGADKGSKDKNVEKPVKEPKPKEKTEPAKEEQAKETPSEDKVQEETSQ
jgi:large subunit ribosomal protein L15